MVKKISYLALAFIFSFVCFSSNVKAISYNSLTNFENIDIEFVKKYDEYIGNYVEENPGKINACVWFYDYLYDYFLQCSYVDLNNPTISNDSVLFSPINNSAISFYYSNGNFFTISSSMYYLYSFSDARSPIFWLDDDYIYSGTSELIISDEDYNLITSNLKEHYNFQNYISNGKPFYSIINLLLGDWKGYTGIVDLVYCIDNVCEDTSQKSISYKYGVENELINISEYLDSTYNGYKLDSSKTYEINASSANTLNVYYYSTDVDYIINYYYDEVLQEDLSVTKSGSVNSTITLNDLEEVVDDIYFLDTSKEYSIVLSDSQENIINVYYKSYDMNYNVNVYLDDIYYQSHSYIGVAKLGSEVILEDLVKNINVYTLDEREYKVLISDNSQLNYINVYYYSENYDTKYQDIDTSGKFYISFDWIYIKELFSLNGNYTQTEQFVIVYVVNFLFYAIVVIVGYFALKMINKLFSILKMF